MNVSASFHVSSCSSHKIVQLAKVADQCIADSDYDHITNKYVMKRARAEPNLLKSTRVRKCQYFGHMARAARLHSNS